MNSKQWIIIVFFIPIVLSGVAIILIKTFNLPLRFSNSISYDVKLNYIQNNKLMNNSDTIVIGSSMALNNINGIELEDNSINIKKVANLSSWGLQTSEVLQLIKLVDLKNIKYLIYSTQYFDFRESRLKNIDEKEVEKYLNNQFTLYPYKITIQGLTNNLANNIRYKNLYLNPNKYSYLDYDRTGSINLTFGSEFIKKDRWENEYKKIYNLSTQCFEALAELSQISKLHNIQLIVITTPIRKSILYSNEGVLDIFNEFTTKLSNLSIKQNFIYLNTQSILNLTDEYFVDRTHLNKNGATLVSAEISKLIDINIKEINEKK